MPIMLRATTVAVALAVCFPTAAQEPSAVPHFEVRSLPGFRLSHPGYRQLGKEVELFVELCRLPGWAGSSPTLVHFERQSAAPDGSDHVDVRVRRLGLRPGENCQHVAARVAAAPAAFDVVQICLAYAHERCELRSRHDG